MAKLLPFDSDFASTTEFARYYRSLNWQVVPALEPREAKAWKRPALASWKEYERVLVDDLVFDRWYGPAGQYLNRQNLGVICGPASNGLWILDLDTQKNPMAQVFLDQLIEQNGGPFKTPTQRTGGGGLQIVFRAPEGWNPGTGKTAMGVDVRGTGGFAMLPCSRHESGNFYEWLPGLAPWEIEVAVAPQFLCTAVDHVLKVREPGAAGQKTESPDVATNAFGQIVDGRESVMTRYVWGALCNLYRKSPILPPADQLQALAREVFGQYESKVKSRIVEPQTPNHVLLEREGRGVTLFQQKWQSALQQWNTKVAEHAAVPQTASITVDPETGEVLAGFEVETPVENLFELLNVAQIKALPDPLWLVEGLFVEKSLAFIYGPPGAGKSFVALSVAFAIACRLPSWFDKPIQRHGPVIYISSEGTADMKFRLMALEQEHAVNADQHPFFLIPSAMSLMDAAQVERLIKTIETITESNGKPVMLFIDTVSRVLPGADENLQKDATQFIAACDALREAFDCTVVGVHHTSRQGNLRGSTVFDGAGDALLSVERDEGQEVGNLIAKKIKSAKDGWSQPFKLVSKLTGDIKGTTSLVATASSEAPQQAESDWPDREVCQSILVAMDAAWRDEKPWSPYVQTKKEGRYAPTIMTRWGISEELGNKMLEAWAVRKEIAVEQISTKYKTKGYRVLKSVAEVGRNLGGS